MSDKITESQIYLFLADYGKDWKDKADKLDNADGKVSKYEFKKFLGQEWNNWGGVSAENISADVINKFWNKLDTNNTTKANLNILDEKELADMEGSLDAYTALNEFIKDKYNTDFPQTGLDSKYGNNWKWDLSDPLTAAINQCISERKTDSESVQNALNAAYKTAYSLATAQCFVAQYTSGNEVKSLLSGLDYSFEDDMVFQNIVKTVVEGLGDITPGKDGAQAIQAKISALVNDYLATAGIGSGNAANIDYNISRLNDLQKAQLVKLSGSALNDKLSSIDIKDRNGKKIDLSNPKYSEAYNAAKLAFADWYINKGSKLVSPAPNQSLFDAMQADLKNNYQALFEQSGAKSIFQLEAQMIDGYLLLDEGNDFYNKIKEAGATEEQLRDIKNYITLGNPEKDFPEYYKAYNEILDAIKSGDSNYLKANGSIDYEAVDAKLLEVIKIQCGIVEPADEVSRANGVNGWSGSSKVVMPVGTTKSFQVTASLDSDIDLSKVSYSVSSANGGSFSVINSANGKFEYTTPMIAGYDTITVNCMYNGEILSSTTITVEVPEIGAWGVDPSGGHLEVYGAGVPANKSQVITSNFTDLYNNNAIIQLHTGDQDGSWYKYGSSGTVISRLKNLLTMIGTALGKNGSMDQVKLDRAIQTVLQQYSNTDNWFADKSRFSGGRAEYCTGKMQSGEYPSNTIVKQHDDRKNATDKIVYMVSFRALVDAVLDAYNK